MKKQITFIGGVGKTDEFGGELTKNKNILRRLNVAGLKVNVVDTWGGHHGIGKAAKVSFKFLNAILFHHNDTFIFSTAFCNVYRLIQIMYILPWHYDIVHWVIGGNFHNRLLSGAYNPKYVAGFKLQIVEAKGMKKVLEEDCHLNNVIVKSNFKDIHDLPAINKYNDGKIHFLFISRITREKGVANIIYATSELNKLGYSDKFIVDFYGSVDPKFKTEFEEGISSNSNLNYCGKIGLLDWNNFSVLARYQYMLFPSYWFGEGCPGVVIDSYIAGVPILGSDWNFNIEYIKNGITGKIFPTRDNEKLISTMKDAIDGKFNCMEMSADCQKEVIKYDTNVVVDDELIKMITK